NVLLPDNEVTQNILRSSGVYYIYGEITPGSLLGIHQDVLLKHFLGKEKWSRPLTFIINSPGGDIAETNALIDLLDNIPLEIKTVGLGECSSCGAILLASGSKGHRTAGPNTSIMIHTYSWGTEGKHHELVAARQSQDAMYKQQIDFWIRHSKYTTKNQVEKYLLSKEDRYFTAPQALEHGIIDKISSVIPK
ncbi:MAG TPA: ATP-dependent Clp protease proteolytic subunit, partial [Candidatus Glassbacteria bacterium]|nr:ATP-dependent Clp protease proteolytic subunit [Candidatus Glassbacteria bacterium]